MQYFLLKETGVCYQCGKVKNYEWGKIELHEKKAKTYRWATLKDKPFGNYS